MNSFETMGEAMLLAHEGQRELANRMARAVGRFFGRRSSEKSK